MPVESNGDSGRRTFGRLRHAVEQRLHVRAWRLRHRAVVAALDRCDGDFHDRRHRRRCADPPRFRSLMMRALASLICGYIFGWGLFVSGMMRPDKVLGFLDVFAIPSGQWDPSLAVVMAVALGVTGFGYALARQRTPVFEERTNGRRNRPSIARLWPVRSCSAWAGVWSGCAGPGDCKSCNAIDARYRLRRRDGARHARP